MIPVPKGKPVIGGLNTFYLDLAKLIEHAQGEIGAGCIHLRSPQIVAAVYFDRDEILETCVETPKGAAHGAPALSKLLEEARHRSYAVDVFSLDPTRVHFWASLVTTERLYGDLSAEFTDLRGLVRKMGAEKLTGFIDAVVPGEDRGALLLFDEGEVVDGSYGLEEDPGDEGTPLEDLVKLCAEKGGTFTVCRALRREPPTSSPPEKGPNDGRHLLDAAEQALRALEAVVQGARNVSTAFSTLLRAKFLGKAGKYEFLDPFAAEFEYADGKIHYGGKTDLRTVAVAVGECVSELARELSLLPALRQRLRKEFGQRPEDLEALGLAA